MSTSHSETICALATPHGLGGLAIIRLSGPMAITILNQLFTTSQAKTNPTSHVVRVGWWETASGKIDEVTATAFIAPSSYTGEDVVEVGCHGGVFVVDQIIESMLALGARHALAGEFTRRAFVNKKMDLTQVEAVADLIHSESVAGAQTAARQLAGGFTTQLSALREKLLTSASLLEVELDFSEDGYEFVSRNAFTTALSSGIEMAERLVSSARNAQILRSGYYVTLVGQPNAGKSSLFNALLNRPRAIVSDIPGTTRDYLQESIIVGGCTVHLLDTAGLRDTTDTIEMQGIQMTRSLVEQSNLVIVVNDASMGFEHSRQLYRDLALAFPYTTVAVAQNKMDILDPNIGNWHTQIPTRDIPTSAFVENGINFANHFIYQEVSKSNDGSLDVLISARQASLLSSLVISLQSALDGLNTSVPADLIAIDLRTAIQTIGEITGETWNPDVLDGVFSRFCIGK